MYIYIHLTGLKDVWPSDVLFLLYLVWSCYSCGIVGERVVTFVSTLPVLLVLMANSVLYSLTWKHIRFEGRRITGWVHEIKYIYRTICAALSVLVMITSIILDRKVMLYVHPCGAGILVIKRQVLWILLRCEDCLKLPNSA